jgi:hypothetical protein
MDIANYSLSAEVDEREREREIMKIHVFAN